MSSEVWKKTAGFEGYEVSTLGNVRSYRVKDHRHPGRFRETPLPLKPGMWKVHRKNHPDTGYLFVNLRRDGRSVVTRIHRLVLLTFVGPPPAGHEAAHLNGNSLDNRLQNLQWVTHAENMAHKRLHGTTNTSSKGESNNMTKLTDDDVMNIKCRLLEGVRLSELGRAYGVDTNTIRFIHQGKTWTHVGPDISGTYFPAKPRFTDAEKQAVVEGIRAGKTIKEIGAEIGRDYTGVARTFERETGVTVRAYKQQVAA